MYLIPGHLKYFHLHQFNTNYDGDFISIQEMDSNGNQILVAYLSGPDIGPKSELSISNWDKKIISISTNRMNIRFKSNDFFEYKGFSANIYFTTIPNKKCESWLDMNKSTFKSPNYPHIYHSTMKCSWLITVDHESYITLDVTEYYVRYQIFISSVFF